MHAPAGTLTPPEIFPLTPGTEVADVEVDPIDTPKANAKLEEGFESDPDPTPRANSTPIA